jgi:tetratricopeptide (TPR) repeat protein
MDLAGSPDFRVVDGTVSSGAADVELRGSLRAAGGSRCVAASLRASSGGRVTPLRTVCAPGGLVDLADSLASLTLLELWTGQQPLIADLPRRALPRTPWGIAAWARAEQLFFEGRWGEAHEAYTQAERADSTCWLCSWRLSITEDWMSFKHDTARTERYLSHADSFPPQYRSLIQAKVLPLGPRLDSLQAAVTRYPRFFFAWFVLGDELFHRGPLAGHSVAEAVQALERATELGAGFAPAWEHLAWAATEAGDSARAHHALDRWLKAMGGEPRDAFSMGLVAMVEAGYAWRFLGSAVAEGLVNKYLRRPEISASPYLIEAPRYMLTFDAPRGAVWLGAQFAGKGRPADLERSGLLARAFGYVALGRPDSAQAALRALVERFPEPELALFADEYSAALAMADSAAVPGWGKRALAELRRAVAPEAGEPLERGRARWMAALVAGDAGQFQGAVPLRDVLDAWLLARAGRWQAAIARTEGLRLSAESEPPDPVLRALLHLGRGEWFARAGGDPVAMRRELRWAGHENVVGTLDVGPQAADVDWSFRTLARWRLATALDRAGEQDAEVCHAYRRVAELWAAGEPIYRARADSARRRLGELAACQGIS